MFVFSLVLAAVACVFFSPAKVLAAIAIVLLVLVRPVQSITALGLFFLFYYLHKRFK